MALSKKGTQEKKAPKTQLKKVEEIKSVEQKTVQPTVVTFDEETNQMIAKIALDNPQFQTFLNGYAKGLGIKEAQISVAMQGRMQISEKQK